MFTVSTYVTNTLSYNDAEQLKNRLFWQKFLHLQKDMTELFLEIHLFGSYSEIIELL